MKRKRDIQGKFTRKNQDYRQVRSLRLTDRTWKAWGERADRFDLSRADLVENLVRQNRGTFPYPLVSEQYDQKKSPISDSIPFNQEKLQNLAQEVLQDLKFKPNSANYKTAQKALKRLIDTLSKYYLEGGD
jgi:hypothetical protein